MSESQSPSSASLYGSWITDFAVSEDWAQAQVNFFEAFKSYDEAGSPQRIQVLKYLVLAHMLMDSQINPFDSQETKPFVHCTIVRLGLQTDVRKPADTKTIARSSP